LRFGGAPAGFVITIRNGPLIYFTGDTDLFQDMRLIPNFGAIDLMFVCIGDHFTMGPARAADAVMLVSPRTVIPMHFGNQPIYTGTPDQFSRELKGRHVNATLKIMRVGEVEEFEMLARRSFRARPLESGLLPSPIADPHTKVPGLKTQPGIAF
jgi:L-ascorbate metabolism protein UlaG (beta-lactamase superfamily)